MIVPLNFLVTFIIPVLVLMPASVVKADMADLISESLWAESCAHTGTREAARWVTFCRSEWCEEFVGDFGRVHSVCQIGIDILQHI